MNDPVDAQFVALSNDLEARLGPSERALLAALERARPDRKGRRGFADLGKEVVTLLRQAAGLAPDRRTLLSRALIARLAPGALPAIAERAVTAEVVERTRKWLPELLAFLAAEITEDYWYPEDLFLKDYRFVTALTVPCGAQVVDLEDGIGPKTALKLGIRHPKLLGRSLARPWFQIHTESRYLAEFNDPGWTSFYRTAVGLLEINPHIEGIVGTSWFYDHQLAEVSPRLAYLRDYPLAHGAVAVKQGTTAFDIKSATATSETRRKLFEAGKYRPECHTIVWPREAMIAWARGESASPAA